MIVVANGDDVEVADGCTVSELLEQLGLARRTIVVERNGEPVPRKEMASMQLSPGDRLELVRAVAGG